MKKISLLLLIIILASCTSVRKSIKTETQIDTVLSQVNLKTDQPAVDSLDLLNIQKEWITDSQKVIIQTVKKVEKKDVYYQELRDDKGKKKADVRIAYTLASDSGRVSVKLDCLQVTYAEEKIIEKQKTTQTIIKEESWFSKARWFLASIIVFCLALAVFFLRRK